MAEPDRAIVSMKDFVNKITNARCLSDCWNERVGVPKKEPTLPEVGPIERERMQRKKPDRFYYWPRNPPPSSAGSISTSPPPEPSGEISTVEVTTPVISICPASPSPEPEATAQALALKRGNPDRSKLTPKRSKGPRSRRSKHRRDRDDDDFMAPKPSIYSFDLCKHPRCPLPYAHEKEIFRRGWVLRTPPEIPEGEFGNFGPCNPPWVVSCALWRVKRRQAQGVFCTADHEDVDIVKGFYEAHCRETDTSMD